MNKLECNYQGGCVVQKLSTALEEIPFTKQAGDRAAGLVDIAGIAEFRFQSGELMGVAEDLANTNPCISCSEQMCDIHEINRNRLKQLRRG